MSSPLRNVSSPPGRAAATPTDDPIATARLARAILTRLRSPGYQPPILPDTALRLLEVSRRPDTTVVQVVSLLESNPVLAASLLRVAASAAYCGATPARTLHEAIVRLGTRTVAAIFFSVWTQAKMFRAPGFDLPMAQLRRHSIATAHAARTVARYAGLDPEIAFLSGLLHDVGAALGLAMAPEGLSATAAPTLAELIPALRAVHAEVGAALCDAWHLPPEIGLVVGHHHTISVAGHMNPVAAVVHLADEAAAHLGYESPFDDGTREDAGRATDVLALTDRSLRGIYAEVGHVLTALGEGSLA